MVENDSPDDAAMRAAARSDLAARWASARSRFQLHRAATESRFNAEMESWRARLDASGRKAFDEEISVARREMERQYDDLLESIGERHLPDFGAPKGSAGAGEGTTAAIARARSAIAVLDELEARCRAGVADAARQFDRVEEAMASLSDEQEREATLERLRSTRGESEAQTEQLLADIARQRAELNEWLQKNGAA